MLRSYAVWDAGTRWFHWINALSVLALIIVGFIILQSGDIGVPNPGKVTLKQIHVVIGYVFLLNLAWRFVWAFMGNRYARWRALLPGGRGFLHALRSYVAAFLAGHPEPYLGHSPLGRIGVSAIFLLITVLGLTGLVLAGTDLFFPPFGGWVAAYIAAPGVDPGTLVPYAPELYDAAAYQRMRDFRAPFVLVHEYGFYALATLVALHVAAVIVTELKEGGSIISAMFTGRKILDEQPRDAAGEDAGPDAR
jgi:cytochrome b